jgi:Holliday junction resolvasome RuvABC endonuclease subunit
MQIRYTEKISGDNYKVKLFVCNAPTTDRIYFGIDPGFANFGVAVWYTNMYTLFQVHIDTVKDQVRNLINLSGVCVLCLLKFAEVSGYTWDIEGQAVIEGASFGDVYGQSKLGEARAVLLCCLRDERRNIKTIRFVPPMSVRKQAFGSGKEHNPYINLPDDAAAALGCAIVASRF